MKTTSETKHTPGPWRIGDAGATIFGPPNGNPSPVTICSMAGPRGDSRANARLIASAPKLSADNAALLAALKALLEYPDNGSPLHPGALVWEDARAAIERAEGGAE